MRVKRNLLSMFLAVVMAIAMMPYMAQNAEAAIIGGELGDDLTWSYSDGVLTISGTGTMPGYAYSEEKPWDTEKSNIKTLVIKSGVKSIGQAAFAGTSIENVTFESPCKLESIGTNSLSGTAIREIKIPDSVTSLGYAVFSGCKSLKTVSIPDGVTVLHSALFSGCTSLEKVSMPAGLTSMEQVVFNECSSLKSITIPAGVTALREEVFSSSGLTSITFAEGSKLKTIASGAFSNCTGLTELVLPEGLTTISPGAFSGCTNITKITLPASLTTIDNSTFYYCPNLKEIAYTGTEEQWNTIAASLYIPEGAAVYTDAVKINGAKVVLANTAFTYNGKVQKPAVKTVGGSALKEGTDFKVSFSASPKNAGTYTMTITGMKKYVGTTKATFKINKAANTMKAKGKKPKVKYKKLKKKAQKIKRTKAIKVSKVQGTVTYKLVSAKKGSKKIKLKKAKKQFKITAKTGKIKVKKKLKKGTYKLKIKVTAAGNANYSALAKTVTVKIKIK